PARQQTLAEGTENLAIGESPLLAAAAPLLQLLARLRNTANPPDTGDLRERTVREIRAFEQRARDTGVPMEQLRPAHYALCASLDDVVLNTPWGSAGGWDARSLVSTFHQEVRSGKRFFDLLKQMKDNPGKFLPVLELMYLCLSLGFIGQYRLSPRGPGEIDSIREETYAIIARNRAAANPELSPHWQGVSAPYRASRARLPIWVAAVAGLAVVGGLFLWSTTRLNASSDDLYARMLAAPPATMPTIARAAVVQPPPPPPEPPLPGVLERLRTFLAPEIKQNLVSVVGTSAVPIVRISSRGMFPSGSATVQASFKPLLDRIGLALKEEPGTVQVVGYTDNQPIHTVAFPSNFALSTARAQAARSIIAGTLGIDSRISAEGRADAEAIASNATPEGRETNRRIEVVLHRQVP
ncbi:type IVB secretion system protein IcmH/DotU, partial [Acidisphaera sp. L21]|uniref:type IVB secretion system protein IcmH/DotU n=1 Tax=Acidisphaera sp. L21 TaxID=1641851 RepID=UPI00131D3C2E